MSTRKQNQLVVFEREPEKWKHADAFTFWSNVGLIFSDRYPVRFAVTDEDDGLIVTADFVLPEEDQDIALFEERELLEFVQDYLDIYPGLSSYIRESTVED